MPKSGHTDLTSGSVVALETSQEVQNVRDSTTLSQPHDRASLLSTSSSLPRLPTRPGSHAFPAFPSSLAYALVRDFAYPSMHPLHYGPLSSGSRSSGADNDMYRFSEHYAAQDEPFGAYWTPPTWTRDTGTGVQQLPAMTFGDGPPYSEDEDLHSPVVTTARHRKHKGPGLEYVKGDDANSDESNEDEGIDEEDTDEYQVHQAAHPLGFEDARTQHGTPLGKTSGPLAHLVNAKHDYNPYEPDYDEDRFRFSRDYQFTIASPDEEMHGKAVALFDFEREHENELPLTEGQVILVSYRHGQGWLVAEDPKTGESGLVPEEFVRLVKDIEGGLHSLNNEMATAETTPFQYIQSTSPKTTSSSGDATAYSIGDNALHNSNGTYSSGEKHPSVVSTFSTSSKDLDPYPQHLLPSQGKNGLRTNDERNAAIAELSTADSTAAEATS